MTYYRYLQGDRPMDERTFPIEPDEGVIVEQAALPRAVHKISRRMGDFVQAATQTRLEREAEEARWAALCGPVEVRYATPRAHKGGVNA